MRTATTTCLSTLALFVAGWATLLASPAFAQDPAPAPAPPAEPEPPPPVVPPLPPAPPPVVDPGAAPPIDLPPPPLESPGPPGVLANLKWEGLVDSYYLYKLTGASSIEDPDLRVFDTLANSFTLAYAKLALQMDADPVGLRVDLGYGQVGAIINRSSLAGSDPLPAAALYSGAFIIQQAYATARLGIATFDAGKFNTTAGAEVTESNRNWLYSRSLLFNGIPALHTGLRLTLKPNELLSLQASLVNGITNNDPDNNAWKTLGLSLGFTPTTATSLSLTAYFGKEGPAQDQGTRRLLLDLVAGQSFGERVAVNLNVDYGKDGDAFWIGGALMGRFVLGELLYVALRAEALATRKGGYGGLTQDLNLFETTAQAGITVGSNYEIRIELRGDYSNKDLLRHGNEARSAQLTALAAFLASF